MATYRGLILPNGSDVPDGPGAFLALAQSLGGRILTGVEDLTELITYSATEYDGMHVHVDELNCDFQARDGVWKQVGTSQLASTSARDSAYAKASAAYRIAGTLSLDTSTGVTWKHVSGTTWAPWESGEMAYTPTLGGMAIGTGGTPVNVASLQIVNGRGLIRHRIVLGNTGSVTGPVTITLHPSFPMKTPEVGYQWQTGEGSVNDISVVGGISNWVKYRTDGTLATRVLIVQNPASPANLSSSSPITFAAGDVIRGEFYHDL